MSTVSLIVLGSDLADPSSDMIRGVFVLEECQVRAPLLDRQPVLVLLPMIADVP